MYNINIFLYVNCILYVYMVFLLTYIQLMLNRWSAAWWFISWMLHPSYPFRDLQWGHSLEGKQTTLLLQEPQTARRGSSHLLMRVGLAYSIINNYLIAWHSMTNDLACWLVTGWQLGLLIIEPHWPVFLLMFPIDSDIQITSSNDITVRMVSKWASMSGMSPQKKVTPQVICFPIAVGHKA